MKKMFGLGLLALGLVANVSAANRVGPVSQYGQLQAGKNSSGKGRIYGSCSAYSTSGNEVAVHGMSLFWSMTKSAGLNFWTGDVIKGLVDKHNIQVIRAPMGVDGSWEDDVGNYYTNSIHETAMNTVVQAAIDNDIYVIIDYHSHCAEKNTSGAATFFSNMAKKWGMYDNVIFEIYNEPKNGDCDYDGYYDADYAKTYWENNIYPYANTVIKAIRDAGSDNLIVVGTPYYDQYVDAALVKPLSDKNVAYTFHYYAGEDEYRHKVDVLGKNPEALMNKGYSVFVTEWGNSEPQGGEGMNGSDVVDAYSAAWYNWMVQNQLSSAHWSVSNKDESASYFNTDISGSTPSSQWTYTKSGTWTNTNVFANNPKTYTACKGSTTPDIGSGTGDIILSSAGMSIITSSSSFVVSEATLIDDFEDGDNVAYTGTGDTWFAFTDAGNNGASSFSNTKGKDTYNVVFDADNGSGYMGGMKDITLSQGDNKYEPYVNMGVAFENGLPGCKTVTYKYKGSAHNFKAVMLGDEKGALSGYDYHKYAVDGSTSWTTASIPVESLRQDGWGENVTFNVSEIANIQWEVKGTASSNYLYIDDLACDGMTITRPVSSSSSDAESSSSEEVVPPPSSSSEEPVVSSSSIATSSSNSRNDISSSSSSSVIPSSSSVIPSSSSVIPSAVEGSSCSVESSSSEELVPPTSSAVVSSSSEQPAASSSSEQPAASSSSEVDIEGSSSSVTAALVIGSAAPKFGVSISGRQVTILGAAVGSKMAVFDLQGSLISVGRITAENFTATLPRSGMYVVRVNNQIQKIDVR